MVLAELAKTGERYIPVGVSARHVHLTEEDIERLFGAGHRLAACKTLSQPGQFASQEQVTLIGPRGKLEKVRILGPARKETQIELAFTDAMKLGVKDAPVRMSGKLAGTPGIKIVGPAGEITPDHGVIVAARHIHLSIGEARAYGVHDGMIVSVRVGGARPCVLENVVCRVGDAHELEFHIDTDEANACALQTGDYVELILPGGHTCAACGHTCGKKKAPSAPVDEPPSEVLDLVVEHDIDDACRKGRKAVYCERAALVTPSAADRAAELGIEIVRADAAAHIPAPAKVEPEHEALELVTEADLNEAFLADRREIYCLKRAVVTDAAQDRALETGIRIVRV